MQLQVFVGLFLLDVNMLMLWTFLSFTCLTPEQLFDYKCLSPGFHGSRHRAAWSTHKSKVLLWFYLFQTHLLSQLSQFTGNDLLRRSSAVYSGPAVTDAPLFRPSVPSSQKLSWRGNPPLGGQEVILFKEEIPPWHRGPFSHHGWANTSHHVACDALWCLAFLKSTVHTEFLAFVTLFFKNVKIHRMDQLFICE